MPWVIAVVAAAGAMASAYAKGDAARKAAGAMKDAIGNVERIDTAKEGGIAQQADRERFTNSLELQRTADPSVAALRELGAAKLLTGLSTAEDAKAGELAMQLAGEVATPDKTTEAIKKKLVDDALADLERGAELPPEFQAELMRSGLEAGGQSGLGVSANTGGARKSRELLGTAGLALKEQRRQSAVGSVSAVSDLNTARANILSGASAFLTNLTDARFKRAGAAFGTANEAVPNVGLSGADTVNIDLARINQAQQLTLAAGNVEAQKRIAQGEMIAGMIGAGTQGVTGALGGLRGGMGGGMGGAGGAAGAAGGASGSGSGFSGLGMLQGLNSSYLGGNSASGGSGFLSRFGSGGR